MIQRGREAGCGSCDSCSTRQAACHDYATHCNQRGTAVILLLSIFCCSYHLILVVLVDRCGSGMHHNPLSFFLDLPVYTIPSPASSGYICSTSRVKVIIAWIGSAHVIAAAAASVSRLRHSISRVAHPVHAIVVDGCSYHVSLLCVHEARPEVVCGEEASMVQQQASLDPLCRTIWYHS
jgi:hypothetical protein